MKITVTNPRTGCAKYTTESQAERYVRRGEAVLIGRELTFLSEAEQKRMRSIERNIQVSERRASDVYVRRQVYWNAGRGEDAMFPPGCVRS